MNKTEFKLKPGQRFVVVDGVHIPCNEKNDTVWFIVLDEPLPVIDPNYVQQILSLQMQSEGYQSVSSVATHNFNFQTEVFRFSDKVGVEVIMAPIKKVIAEHPDCEFGIWIISGAYIPDNWDNNFFKVYVNFVKHEIQ